MASTWEQRKIVKQLDQLVENLHRDMRFNANEAAANATAAVLTPAQIAATLVANFNEHSRIIGMATAMVQRNQALVSNALTNCNSGLALSDLVTEKNALVAVVNHVLAATLTTYAQIQTEAAFVLANVTNLEGMW